ncbi:P-loop containing nucleoside triphosphate hydrolase protein [Ephemerocybe angulata]|uniref:P-loop containing nucleoside triphosphate hydrolase protein n=1 Tax=Ephemerocybe angulata TaxID=980116 RepID=A0A8H6HIH2_9AGAR|nr:P-loop containing nucleoside triphosphate hydrolase protein [Tulosesus angulatus]
MTSKSDLSTIDSGLNSLGLGSTKAKKSALKTSKARLGPKKGKEAQSTDTPASEPVITAYSQQSRFHRETFDANTTDIDIEGVHISIGPKDILVDAHLRLKSGVKYGMVGQNGVGKSVLMRTLGDNFLIGLPQNVRFLHIQQLEEFAPGRTVLQEVLDSDPERVRIIREAKALQKIDTSSPSYDSDLHSAIHCILVERSAAALDLAQKTAAKRSGQRGFEARKALLDAEATHAAIVRSGEHPPPESPDGPTFELTPQIVNATLKEVLEAFELVDEAGDEARARTILRGLGFKDEDLQVDADGRGELELRALSGGWRMRVMLAKALFVKPDVLLLDEPTNHLDLPAILWLEHHLLNSPLTDSQTVVIVSHDRAFLNAVTTETIVFKDKRLTYTPGSYEDWEQSVGEESRRKERLKELDDKRRKTIIGSMQKNVQMARKSGDDKRLGMVASRRKALDRLGMQRLEDGKRYKRSYHGYRAEIVVEEGFQTPPITLPTPHPVPFHSSAILQLSEVSFSYPTSKTKAKSKTPEKALIDKISLDISPNARIALLGPNGCGKSTLMNLLAGTLKPSSGLVHSHPRLRIGYFSQHTVSALGPSLTPFQQLCATYPDDAPSEAQARAHFASTVGLKGDMVVKQRVGGMSGGERSRVALGVVVYREPHVLLLDEITNHLDVGTVGGVVEALREFEGAVVVVSHDVWFLRQVVEGSAGDDEEGRGADSDGEEEEGEKEEGVVYIVNGKYGGLRRWEDGLETYVERVRRRAVKEYG